ncbi:MAG: hypothetical protein KA117_07770 [Verrucomicrobia bacterium]|jgi:hypothetical protein|nr:hypothetical protein [Verrucomicrobiota bacterium]OQC24628.1 MAG: hypothetical protein BWX68_02053 [Verrucomicrobia bacterium ADurb.Bin063]HNW07863.1 hypothetical protein [Verrucomicrobiota bacterium]HNZ76116.1 hypothetical protein [Verrucomicrobiota bacterium]HOC51104.1 hypothetical protein [Verrucomicrobiota bacterium]
MEERTGVDENVLFPKFEKLKTEEVRGARDTFHGRMRINTRGHYQNFAGAILEVGQHLKAQG